MCSICQEKFAEWSEIKNHTLREHGGYLSSENSAGRWRCFQILFQFQVKSAISVFYILRSSSFFSQIPIKRKIPASLLLKTFGLNRPSLFCDCFEKLYINFNHIIPGYIESPRVWVMMKGD